MDGTEIKINLNKYDIDGEVVIVKTKESKDEIIEEKAAYLPSKKNIRCLFQDIPIKRANSRIMLKNSNMK